MDVAEPLEDLHATVTLKIDRVTRFTMPRLRIGMAVFGLGLRIAGFTERTLETENGAGHENQPE